MVSFALDESEHYVMHEDLPALLELIDLRRVSDKERAILRAFEAHLQRQHGIQIERSRTKENVHNTLN